MNADEKSKFSMPSSRNRSDADERQNPEEPKYFSPKRRMLIALHPKFFVALGFVVAREEGEANNYYLEDLLRDGEEREADYRKQRRRRRWQEATPTRSPNCDADEKSRFSMPDVDTGHFSTLNADEKSKFSTPDVDKKQQGDVATREVEEHDKCFAEPYARVFSTLATDEKLAADEKS
jgi:hypothetical protein